MKYLDESFSVTMPSGVDWPFKKKEPRPADCSAVCPRCGALCVPGQTHTDRRDVGHVRQRVCFGARKGN